jgi:hypothetical protein
MSICSQQEANVAATWKMDHGQRHALLNRNASTLLAEPRIQILAAQQRVLPKAAPARPPATRSCSEQAHAVPPLPELELSNNLAESSI